MAPPLISSLRAAVRRARTERVSRELAECHLLAGFWCHGLTVRQLQGLRGALPKTARLVVAKNSVVANSISTTPWAPLGPCAKGMVAWLFVHTDEIRPALAACREFQREWKLGLHDFTGAVFERRLYGPDDFEVLETMPTKPESHAYLLGCLQTPAFSLIGILNSIDGGEASAEASAPSAE